MQLRATSRPDPDWAGRPYATSARVIDLCDRFRLPAARQVPQVAPWAMLASIPQNSVSTHAYSASSCWPLARSIFSNH